MLHRHALGEVLRELRHSQHKTLRTVSSEARVALGYLSELEHGSKEASSEIIIQIARALNVPTHLLYIEAGFRMAQLSIPDTVEALLESDLTLSDH